MSESSVATIVEVKEEKKHKPKRCPQYNVVLLDDDDHTYDYVIRMLGQLFAKTQEESFQLAEEVDKSGRVILMTTTKEHAELKQEQIHAFGVDPLLPQCAGSMTSVLEPTI